MFKDLKSTKGYFNNWCTETPNKSQSSPHSYPTIHYSIYQTFKLNVNLIITIVGIKA